MKNYKLKSVSEDLTEYCIHAKEHDFIELSLWHNGEGVNISINDRLYSFTFGELKAIKKLTKELRK